MLFMLIGLILKAGGRLMVEALAPCTAVISAKLPAGYRVAFGVTL